MRMPNLGVANSRIFSGQRWPVAVNVETVDVNFRACQGITDWVENPGCRQSWRRWDGPTLARSMISCDGHVFDSLVWKG